MSHIHSKMVRVNRERPCPICGRADWCLVRPDGSAAICPRTPDSAVKMVGEAGYLHVLSPTDRDRGRPGGAVELRLHAPDDPERWGRRDRRCRRDADPAAVDRLARELGVSAGSLRRLGLGWSRADSAWSFPMLDADGRVVGLRLRSRAGHKFAIGGAATACSCPRIPASIARPGSWPRARPTRPPCSTWASSSSAGPGRGAAAGCWPTWAAATAPAGSSSSRTTIRPAATGPWRPCRPWSSTSPRCA